MGPRVRILGGGVAGLSCALALQRRAGLDAIRVYERRAGPSEPERVGHGLILTRNGVAALRALDMDHLLEGCTPLTRALFQDDRGIALRTESFRDVYCMSRAAIVDALREAVGDDRIEFGRLCTRVELDPVERRRVRAVLFSSGEAITAEDDELFVGAEGYRSPTCAALNPGVERPVSRVREIVTSTYLPPLAYKLGSTFVKTLFPMRGAAFGLLAATPSRVIGYLQFDSERYQVPPPEHLREFMFELLAGAPEPIPSYLAQADLDSAHLWDPVNADMPERLCCDNAVVIGDAAHPLLPFSSQGVSAALQDSVILADALHSTKPGALPAVLSAFCEDRRQHLADYVRGGRQILSSFVDTSSEFALPTVDGAASKLEEHLSLPPGSLKGLLRVLDGDGDGCLDRIEFDAAVRLFELDIGPAKTNALFAEIDADEDGRLGMAELLSALGGSGPASDVLAEVRQLLSPRKIQLYTLEHRARCLFRQMDETGDGYVDFLEFLTSLAVLGIVATEQQCRQMFDELDSDGDGKLSCAELVAGVTRAPTSALARAAMARPSEEGIDELFSHSNVSIAVLRERAFNNRWAEQPRDVIPLSGADSDFPVAEPIREAIERFSRDGYAPYGPAAGLPVFRHTVEETLNARHHIGCDAARVFATDSAASAVFLVARVTLEPGDQAVIFDPVDFVFERAVRATGAELVRLPIRHGAFDIDELESLIEPGKTKLLAICNPHSPLGRVWTRGEIELLASVAVRHGLWILSDEVWADVIYSPARLTSPASLGKAVADRTFSVYGFSKSYGLAGLRLGVLVAPTPQQFDAIVAASGAGSMAYGASTLSQMAGIAAYKRAGDWLARFVGFLESQRDYATNRLENIEGVTCSTPEGTFVLFPDVSRLGLSETVLAETLAVRYRVAAIPGSRHLFGPGGAGHVRISFATSREILAEGLDRLEAGLTELSQTTP